MHLAGLEAMGATFEFGHGYVEACADRLHGADITFDFPSVGATENILTAAVHADGTRRSTTRRASPRSSTCATSSWRWAPRSRASARRTLRDHGVEPRAAPRGATTRRSPDRIQAATYIAACAVAGGEIDLLERPARPHGHGAAPVPRHGSRVSTRCRTGSRVAAADRMRSIDVATLPYPGIATDYKPLIITMLSVADGVGIVTENLYPGRFRYVEELQRLGADIRTDGHHAVVRGVPAPVGRTGAGARHPCRRGAGGGRPGRRGHDHDHWRPPHRPRLRRPRRPARGVGADIERIDSASGAPGGRARRRCRAASGRRGV